jgi:predicted HicB family RNase H-like nuclease
MNNTLQHKGYYAEIHFSSEDETFYGKLIGINDLVNFEADSVKGLKKACAEAVEDYLDTCKAIKKSPEKHTRVALMLEYLLSFTGKLQYLLL